MNYTQAIADLPLDLKVTVHTAGGQTFIGTLEETSSTDTLVLLVGRGNLTDKDGNVIRHQRQKWCYIRVANIEAIAWEV